MDKVIPMRVMLQSPRDPVLMHGRRSTKLTSRQRTNPSTMPPLTTQQRNIDFVIEHITYAVIPYVFY